MGPDYTSQTIFVVTLIFRSMIACITLLHYFAHLDGNSANIIVGFFAVIGSLFVAVARITQCTDDYRNEPHRAKKALYSGLISLAFAAWEGWQLFTILLSPISNLSWREVMPIRRLGDMTDSRIRVIPYGGIRVKI